MKKIIWSEIRTLNFFETSSNHSSYKPILLAIERLICGMGIFGCCGCCCGCCCCCCWDCCCCCWGWPPIWLFGLKLSPIWGILFIGARGWLIEFGFCWAFWSLFACLQSFKKIKSRIAWYKNRKIIRRFLVHFGPKIFWKTIKFSRLILRSEK